MILERIQEFNSLLDAMLQKHSNTNIGAIVPYPYTGRGLGWISPYGSCSFVYNNDDIEQQFHWVYGPYVSDDYLQELDNMIKKIVKTKHGNFICSTVNISTEFYADILSINIIVIRPCLQRRHIFGKILYELSKRLEDGITLRINRCMPESQQAIKKYYGGETVFKASRDKMTDASIEYVTFELKDKAAFQRTYESLPEKTLPTAEEVNGKSTSIQEKGWIRFAEANLEVQLADKFIEYQFKTGYANVSPAAFHEECDEMLDLLEREMQLNDTLYDPHDEDVTAEEIGEAQRQNRHIEVLISMIETMFDARSPPSAMLFTSKTDLHEEYEREMKPIRNNVFYRSIVRAVQPIPSNTKEQLERQLELLNSMQSLLQETEKLRDEELTRYENLPTACKHQLETNIKDPALRCMINNLYIKNTMYVDRTLRVVRLHNCMTIPRSTFLRNVPRLSELLREIIQTM